MVVEFNFQTRITLTERTRLKEFILSIFKKEKKSPGTISFVFCSDEYLLEMNRSYLNHNYYTDIITFDLSASPASPIDGEIYISADTVRDNAKRFRVSINKELHRVIFHGILHLCGYKDKNSQEQRIMSTKEDKYLSLYFPVPRNTVSP